MKSNISTLDKLILIKTAKDKQSSEPIVYKIIGTDEDIVIKKPAPKDIIAIMNEIDDDAPLMELWDELIYMAMPELQDKEVLEHFECTDNPVSIVEKVFSSGDRKNLGLRIREVLNDCTIEEVKN